MAQDDSASMGNAPGTQNQGEPVSAGGEAPESAGQYNPQQTSSENAGQPDTQKSSSGNITYVSDNQEQEADLGQQDSAAGSGAANNDDTVPEAPSTVQPTVKESVNEATEELGQKIKNIEERHARKRSKSSPVVAIAAIVIIIIIAYALFRSGLIGQQTGPTTYTTAQQSTELSACGVISSPGAYTVHSDIFTKIASGPCIDIKSSNVRLTGSNVKLSGSGPFVNTPPYTYGILVQNASNVSIQGVNVSRFSYAVYFSGATGSSISNSRTGNSTMSDVYLNDSPHSTISNDIIFGSSDPSGALFIDNKSSSVSVVNSIVEYNAYYGAAVFSTNNLFYGDNLLGNQADLYCSPGPAAYSSSSSYSDSACSVNRNCNFATCEKANYDFNPAIYNLSGSINACGSIIAPGSYSLQSSLDLGKYVNVSRSDVACITISSPNVRINCNGFNITGAHYGIYGKGAFNFSVDNCRFVGDTYGTYFNNSQVLSFSNINYSLGIYGMYLQNDSFVNATSVSYHDNVYGAYIGNSVVGMYGITARSNIYGLYFNGSSTSVLYNGSISGSGKVDLYCTANAYNRSGTVASKIACGTSDCNWAEGSCSTRVLPPLVAYPVNSCTQINVPGNYSLNTNLLPNSTCIRFAASNIKFDCNSHIFRFTGLSGAAFYASRVSNITLVGCNAQGFSYGLQAYNSSGINLTNSKFSSGGIAVMMHNVSGSRIFNVSASNYTRYGFYLQSVRNTVINNSSASSLISNTTGFSLMGSVMNTFMNNTASNNRNVGFSFSGSRENFVANNTGNANGNDYACSPDSSGIYAELGGVNYGLTKTGCIWLAELPKTTSQQSCFAINTVNKLYITHDMLFPYGTTCFSIYNSNKSTQTVGSLINCEGHTIYASKGGVFAEVFNTSNIEIENCYLKNFTNAITSSAAYTSIVNITIATASNAITLSDSNYSSISDVHILNATDYGILLADGSSHDTVSSVNISSSGTGISTGAGASIALSGVNITGASTGISFGSGLSTIANSRAYGSSIGLDCLASAQAAAGNRDLGGNACSSTNCAWTVSTMCKA